MMAETVFAEVIDTVQVSAAPLQAPPQTAKVAPLAGVAVSVDGYTTLNLGQLAGNADFDQQWRELAVDAE